MTTESIEINRVLLRRLDEMIRGQTDSGLFPYRTYAEIEDFFADLWIDLEGEGSRSSTTFGTLLSIARMDSDRQGLWMTDALARTIAHLADHEFFGSNEEQYLAAVEELNHGLARFGLHVLPGTNTTKASLVRTATGDTEGDNWSYAAPLNDFYAARPRAFTLPRIEARDNPLCAVIMPFKPDLDEVFEQVVKPTAHEVGFEVLRADDIWQNQKVMDDIAYLILNASVIVADLTGQNANVFYELGIAHLAGRMVVPIVQNQNDVPFDIRSDRYLLYQNTSAGRVALEKALHARLSQVIGDLSG